jgi:hypothetical protein
MKYEGDIFFGNLSSGACAGKGIRRVAKFRIYCFTNNKRFNQCIIRGTGHMSELGELRREI